MVSDQRSGHKEKPANLILIEKGKENQVNARVQVNSVIMNFKILSPFFFLHSHIDYTEK